MNPKQTNRSTQSVEFSFPKLISTCITARLIVDTGVQLFNPFLSLFAAGLRTDVVTMGSLVSLRSIMGMLAPLWGTFADRKGFRLAMRLGLLIAALGIFLVGISSNLALAAIGMAIWGLGIAGFVPTMHAYLSARLPYATRGRAIGIIEYSWALAGIVGLFSLGYLISMAGWRAPFFLLSAGMLLAWFITGRLPATNRAESNETELTLDKPSTSDAALPTNVGQRIRTFFDMGTNNLSAYATICASTCLFLGSMQVMITYGSWLMTEYEIGPTGLGTVALLLGFSDWVGSISVSLLTDRLGKRRSVLLGSALALIGYILMPFLNVSLGSAIAGIALARSSFEFAIVSNIPLLSEQVPEQRGKLMNLSAAFSLGGVTLSSITGPWLYSNYGVIGLSMISALVTVLSIAIVFVGVKERG